MPDDTVKLGSMEIEIITNAKKAGEDMNKMGKMGIATLGALGGATAAVGLSFTSMGTSFLTAVPNIDIGLTKIWTGVRLIGINSNESFKDVAKMGDAFLKFAKDADINDFLNKRFVFEPKDVEETKTHFKDLFDGIEDLMPDWLKEQLGIDISTPGRIDPAGVQQQLDETGTAYPKGDMYGGYKPSMTVHTADTQYRQDKPGYHMEHPIDTSGFGGGTSFGQGTGTINVFLDGKMLDSQPAYFGR